MYLENIDRKRPRVDLLKPLYPHVDYPHHPTYVQIFFRELSRYLKSEESLDLTWALLQKYVLDKNKK